MNKLKSIERLEDSFSKLPGVGKKSAERLAYSLLNMNEEDIIEFSNALKDFKKEIKTCPICGMITENDKCEICSDLERDHKTIMVVSYPKDVISLENTESYKGLYHVLNGEICISKGIAVEDLNIESLFERIKSNIINEIILATNPTIDGETTALYLAKRLEKTNIKVTRLAYGLQMGGNLDYTDQLTLLKALEGRRKV